MVCIPVAGSTQASRSGGLTSVKVAAIRWLPCAPSIRVSNRPPGWSSTMIPSIGVTMPLGPQNCASSLGSVRHRHTRSRGARKTRR